MGTSRPSTPKIIEHAIDDLKATKFEKFTDNFIQVEAMPSDVDWFDDPQWEAVVHNFRILAHVAKQGGCVGLEFDPEQYGSEYVFTPLAWGDSKLHGKTEEQFNDQAMLRGQQLDARHERRIPRHPNPLPLRAGTNRGFILIRRGTITPCCAPFIEGMCRAADDNTEIIDGFEQSYGYHVEPSFAAGRESILRRAKRSPTRAAFDRVMRVGFGLWTDNGSGQRGWLPDQPEKNHFQPATWQNAVHWGLSYSDRYVWVWREKIHEWESAGVAPAYEHAQCAARTSVVHVDVTRAPVTGLRR